MIIVKLMGGLGNQLFQYAAGRRLSLVHKTCLKLDLSWFAEIHAVDTNRKYELAVYPIQAVPAMEADMQKFRRRRLSPKLNWLARTLLPLRLQRYIQERHYHFDPEILLLPDNVYLDGYWQSPKYFSDCTESIRREFTIQTELDGMNRHLADIIHETESVSVHVRRGDYVTNPKVKAVHGVCSLEYYQKAVFLMNQRLRLPHYFIFSDDPHWIRENITFINPVTIVDHNGSDKAGEDMRLMSLCKHHIIANSSFSWWGAWLCTNPHKIIIAPMIWFNDANLTTVDLIPRQWVQL